MLITDMRRQFVGRFRAENDGDVHASIIEDSERVARQYGTTAQIQYQMLR